MKRILKSIANAVSDFYKKKKREFDDDGTPSKFCVSMRALLVLNLLSGHWFAVTALKIRSGSCGYALSYAVFFFSHAVMIAYTWLVMVNAYETCTHGEFKVSTVATVLIGLLGILLAFWRTCCIVVNQFKASELVATVLRCDAVHRRSISCAAKRSLFYFLFYFFVYFTFVMIGTITMIRVAEEINRGNQSVIVKPGSGAKYTQYIQYALIFKRLALSDSVESLELFILLLNAAAFIEMVKFIVTDVINYFFYFVVTDLFRNSEATLAVTLESQKLEALQDWLGEHQFCERFLAKVNSFTSPNVIATVILCTLQVCIVDFVVAKGMFSPGYSFVMFTFGVLALMQIFIYCYVGQQIRKSVLGIRSTVMRCGWISGSVRMQNALLMILSATDDPQHLSQIGGPFFSLSMEFFISILSAVLTYFLILLQFK